MDTGEIFNPGCGGPGGAGCCCENCEEWRRYCYWNHDHGDGRPRQFLLFASDDKDQLCIPWEVSSQLRNMIPDSEPIKLETPDGRTYSVQFVKFGRITLTTGWRGFVDANHIEENNPMLFVYRGNSTFNVHIFDSSGRDKFLPCSQPPCDHHVLNEQVVPHPGHVDPSGSEKTFAMGTSSNAQEKPPLPPTITNLSCEDNELTDLSSDDNKLTDPSSQNNELTDLSSDDNELTDLSSDDNELTDLSSEDNELVDLSSDDEVTDPSSDYDEVVGKDTTTSRREQRPLRSCRAKAEKMGSTSCPSTKSDHGHTDGNSNEAGIEAHMPNKSYMVPRAGATKLTVHQEEKVKEKVRAIGSEFPVYVKVMTADSVLKPAQLPFCMEYASACRLPLEQTPLLLRLAGSDMQWRSSLMVQQSNNVRRICTFWKDIVSQAGMEAGDICLVELVGRSSKRLRMTVHLIRKSEMQL